MKRQRANTIASDHKRHGATTLFAVKVLDFSVINRNMRRHRHQDLIHFPQRHRGRRLRPASSCMSLSTANPPPSPQAIAWLTRHSRFVFNRHTHLSLLARRRGRLLRHPFSTPLQVRSSAPSSTCRQSVNHYVEDANRDTRPFAWTANPNNIAAARQRTRHTSGSLGETRWLLKPIAHRAVGAQPTMTID